VVPLTPPGPPLPAGERGAVRSEAAHQPHRTPSPHRGEGRGEGRTTLTAELWLFDRRSAVARRLAPAEDGAGEAGHLCGLSQPVPAGLVPLVAGFSPPAPWRPRSASYLKDIVSRQTVRQSDPNAGAALARACALAWRPAWGLAGRAPDSPEPWARRKEPRPGSAAEVWLGLWSDPLLPSMPPLRALANRDLQPDSDQWSRIVSVMVLVAHALVLALVHFRPQTWLAAG
jgi:hypothetical protein